MKNFNELKRKLLQDRATRKAYEELAPQYAIIEMIIKRRLKTGLSQEALAEKIGHRKI